MECLFIQQQKKIEETINRAIKNGGKELFPHTKASEYGYVAEIEDSEGNRIGLSEFGE